MTTTTESDDRRLYHATTSARADLLMAQGFDATGSFWGTEAMSDYYLETVDDEIEESGQGSRSVLLSIAVSDLDPGLIDVDQPAIDEPITTVLGMKEGEVHRRWAACAGTWEDSLEIAGSVLYRGPIAAALLRRED
jgi:hypothetical protein